MLQYFSVIILGVDIKIVYPKYLKDTNPAGFSTENFSYLNAIVWFSYWFLSVLLFYPFYEMDLKQHFALFLSYILGYLITLILIPINKRIDLFKYSLASVGVIFISASALGGLVWLILDDLLTGFIYGFERILLPEFFSAMNIFLLRLFRYLLIIFAWEALYYAYFMYGRSIEERKKIEEANNLLNTMQLKMLRYQLTPHFLFNSLNSIRALIHKEPDKARALISELSEFLKYTLTIKDKLEVSLSEELEAINHYLELEKTRFEEKLIINIEIDPSTEDIYVPALILHPLVENAIKYGMVSASGGMTLMISSKLKNDSLILEVRNSGGWIDKNEHDQTSTNTGLANVEERLKNSFGGKAEMNIEKNESFVSVKIIINHITEHLDQNEKL